MAERWVGAPHRAPVQSEYGAAKRSEGTITWSEHLEVFEAYAKRYGRAQSAERIAERGGFGYKEATVLLGRELTSWEPRRG